MREEIIGMKSKATSCLTALKMILKQGGVGWEHSLVSGVGVYTHDASSCLCSLEPLQFISAVPVGCNCYFYGCNNVKCSSIHHIQAGHVWETQTWCPGSNMITDGNILIFTLSIILLCVCVSMCTCMHVCTDTHTRWLIQLCVEVFFLLLST